jgi:ubiquinone biosynthesis protein COQ9
MGKLSQRLHWATREINHLVLHDGKYCLESSLSMRDSVSGLIESCDAKIFLATDKSTSFDLFALASKNRINRYLPSS